MLRLHRTPAHLLMVILSLATGSHAGTALDSALEDFAITVTNDQQTPDTTPESINADLQYFEFDIDHDGSDEIFVSRPDWSSNDTWMLYRRLGGPGAGIKNLGMATIHPATVRSGERDGKKGYYESYHYYGNNTDRIIFNAFDEQGNLVALVEETIESAGKDKALWESIHPAGSSAPEIRTVPVAPLRAEYHNRMNREKSAQPIKKTSLPDAHPNDKQTAPDPKPTTHATAAAGRKNQPAAGPMLWILPTAAAIALFLTLKYRNRIFGRSSSAP
jgi:hypothetical protein